MNIAEYFQPNAADVPYVPEEFEIPVICRIDSYKFSHAFAYPDDVVIDGMTSYGEARVSPDDVIVPFGGQIFANRFLTETITKEDVDFANNFALKHFGRPLFAYDDWMKIVTHYHGKLPLIIRSVPEGTIMRGSMPIYTVTVFDRDLFWMSAAFETPIQRAYWYPTTIATNDYKIKQYLRSKYLETGVDPAGVDFAYHDFGGRGVTCAEQAEIGGAAHLVNFKGSDTVEGVLAANHFYKEDMAGFSVYATEHAVQCTFGPDIEDAKRYLSHQLRAAEPGTIVSIVLDGYNVYREVNLLCTTFRDQIIASDAKIVFRPDSGDMMYIVPYILEEQEKAFGYDLTSTGHKKIRHVAVIQGDGIDAESLRALIDLVVSLGYSADNVVLGSGGALLQKVNRDTLKFAQKACAILVDGKWIGIAKDPITDKGKKSKEGVLTVGRRPNGELFVGRLDDGSFPEDAVDIMQTRYYLGTLYNETTLAEVRARASI